ncbi:MAG: hypothetical protein AB7S71_10885 [Dongiaceae bacterium]
MKTACRLTAAFALGLLFLPTAASADSAWGTRWFNARDTRQDLRTDAGIANDTLTARETVRIERRDTRLDNATDRALSDGNLSRYEARRLNHAYSHQSRFIYRQKHDAQNR